MIIPSAEFDANSIHSRSTDLVRFSIKLRFFILYLFILICLLVLNIKGKNLQNLITFVLFIFTEYIYEVGLMTKNDTGQNIFRNYF